MARGAILIVKSDCSRARIYADASVREWTAPALPDDRPPTVREARARAGALASWIARDPDARKRIEAMYTDVDEAVCVWMRAPSAARPVVAAHLRTMAQDWGPDAAVLAVEPIRDEAPRARRPFARRKRATLDGEDAEDSAAPTQRAEPAGFPVIALPDAMIRLVADAADAAGARIATIGTLWHLLADASESTGDVRATVVLDNESARVVWAWSDDAGLIAGGEARADTGGPESTAQRVALDWLTWSAQLGRCPASVRIIGPDPEPWSAALGALWPDAKRTTKAAPDALREACASARPSAPGAAPSGRTCLARVSARPTRATRRRYQLAGAALVISLIAVSSVGFRLWRKAHDWRDDAAKISETMAQDVRDTWPDKTKAQPIGNPRRAAETFLSEELLNAKTFEPPPKPRPILEETLRISGILAAANAPADGSDSPPGSAVILDQLSLDQERGCSMSFRVTDRQLGNELLISLNANSKILEWKRAQQSTNPNAPNLTGEWMKGVK